MVYVVEDEPSILELILYALNTQNIQARGFQQPSDFWKAMREKVPKAIVLDIMLPQEDGLSILRKIRTDTGTRAIPVMMLTALGSEFERVKGLDTGADDYLAKPFGVMEMLARVRVMLRRTDSRFSSDVITVGEVTICLSKRTVKHNGTIIALTVKEFDILYLFMSSPERVFTREELLSNIWGYAYRQGESRTVDIHINTLRQKLGDWGKRIKTVRGIGYKLLENAEAEIPQIPQI